MSSTPAEHLRPGRVGYGDLPADSPLQLNRDQWLAVIGGIKDFFPGVKHPDFIEAFVQAVPNLDLQKTYVRNTSYFLEGKADYDPNFVLIFRRTLPMGNTPKAESYWTTDYITAFRGLQKEIRQAHRLYSVILCSTLAQVEASTGGRDPNGMSLSDGEIKFLPQPYDQNNALFSFRPKEQEAELQRYLKEPGALTLEQVREIVTQEKE